MITDMADGALCGVPAILALGIAWTSVACNSGGDREQKQNAPRRTAFVCESGKPASGAIVDVRGTEVVLREQPAASAKKLVNQKASAALGETHYHQIDSSTRVRVECLSGDWARVRITEPPWLNNVVGWVKQATLDLPRKEGEFRTFTENDIVWDKHTEEHKSAIVRAINRVHRQDPRCATVITPAPYRSPSRSKPGKPTFFIQCGEGETVNVFFGLSDDR